MKTKQKNDGKYILGGLVFVRYGVVTWGTGFDSCVIEVKNYLDPNILCEG